jgi:hypothetical protein
MIVGAKLADPVSESNAGKSYVVFGKTDSTAINLSAIASGTGRFVINGEDVDEVNCCAVFLAEVDIGFSCV